MSAIDRLLTILLWAIAFGLSEGATKKKKKKKISTGAIVAIIIVIIAVIIIGCLILFLLRRRKAKNSKIANVSQEPLGVPSGGGEGYQMGPGAQAQGTYEPVQQYQQQTPYGQQPYGAPPQQQGYGQGPPASYPGGPPAHGAANDYYKP
ncbi:hypothetical protein HYFRA_00011223 [Hymenoscyphus fraxineus]|uniref:Uncharacterized protein n=1 Tax=Hymenoscyphus fraxineus TaxID=746836 RepID=A0A9N9KZQ1_9HELO|nr:hypothetical protein HYFRA_00011223 [Hymenoscyphus fraxineus]